MENELDNQESLILDENQDSNLENEFIEESPEELKEKLLKAEELAKNQKIRAEKAEKALKQIKPEKPMENETPKNEQYTLKELKALGNVHEEDLDRVTKWAKAEGITIDVALKDPDLQAVLKRREEERRTAEATNVAPARRGTSTPTPEAIIENFSKGNIPSKDEDITKLVEAQIAMKKAIAKGN
jgi:hypothetical protein